MSEKLIGAAGRGEVSFPAGVLQETTAVSGTVPYASGVAVFVDRTPFHPVDPAWPDQPDDRGWAEWDGHQIAVIRSLTAAVAADGSVALDTDISARKGDDGMQFVVAHVLENATMADALVGRPIVLSVDPDRRVLLSAVHTACHLTAYAFNDAVGGLWKKPARPDALGRPDFDNFACTLSRHHEAGFALDTYRLGKSLRKSFDTDTLLSGLDGFVGTANETLQSWLAADSRVSIRADGQTLTDRRTWVCELPEGDAQMPCGGTHVARLGQIGSIVVRPAVSETRDTLTLTTTVTLAP